MCGSLTSMPLRLSRRVATLRSGVGQVSVRRASAARSACELRVVPNVDVQDSSACPGWFTAQNAETQRGRRKELTRLIGTLMLLTKEFDGPFPLLALHTHGLNLLGPGMGLAR